MERAKADPRPCERCGHRRDMHELFRGLRVCRACDYIALRWPCSTARVRDEALLESLSFDLGT
jgi:hypothetical protein